MNKYDLEHVTTGHPVMASGEWQEVYPRAWDLYYSAEHIERVFRRAKASGIKPVRLLNHLLQLYFTFAKVRSSSMAGGSAKSSKPTSSWPPSISICIASAAASNATRALHRGCNRAHRQPSITEAPAERESAGRRRGLRFWTGDYSARRSVARTLRTPQSLRVMSRTASPMPPRRSAGERWRTGRPGRG